MNVDIVERLRKRTINCLQFSIAAALVGWAAVFLHTRFGWFGSAHMLMMFIAFSLTLLCALLLFGLLNLALAEFHLRKKTEGNNGSVSTTVTIIAADAVVLAVIFLLASELLEIIKA